MKSIRLSLILYFFLLLAVALGGVSLFGYQSTQQALLAKEINTKKLWETQYENSCKAARADFDKELVTRAKALAGKITWKWHQHEALNWAGVIGPAVQMQGHLSASLGWYESFHPQMAWSIHFLRPNDIRIPRHEDDEMPLADKSEYAVLEKDEYFQIYQPRFRAPPQLTQCSENLQKGWLQLDEDMRRNAEGPGHLDEMKLPTGAVVRRVTLRLQVGNFGKGLWLPMPSWKGKKMPSPDAGRGRFVYFQYAHETSSRERKLEELQQNLQHEVWQLAEDTQTALGDLRRRMLWIGLIAFAALVVGGFWLVRLGLSPLDRLSEAVSKVSVKDFRLPINEKKLPVELKPIAERMSQTLDQLKRTFTREKQAAADISHELRTPLAALMTTISVALKKQRTPEEYQDVLEDCKASGQQMTQLVERLLALARLDAGAEVVRPRDVDVANLAQQCADLLRPLAQARGVKLRVHANGPAHAHADADKLREILNNLLHNAIEYNKPEGEIDLTVARVNGRLTMEVRDTGVGIAAEAREHIFERFYRADPARSDGMHAGLGLSIVKGYVDLMGGTIAVESNSRGSTFRVDVPVN